MAATRKDVAQLARTSTAVVSYVINRGPRGVSPATRDRVLAAIEQLGYRPNAVARALATSTSKTIGLIVPDLLNPFFTEMAQFLENAAYEAGYTVIFGSASRDQKRLDAYLATFASQKVAAIVAVDTSGRGWEGLKYRFGPQDNIPMIFLDRVPKDVGGRAIRVDSELGGYLATKHLIEHGHRRIGVVRGPDHGFPTAEGRQAGWERALREVGLDPTAMPIIVCEFDRYDAQEVVTRALAKGYPPALFVHSDDQAIGVLNAARALAIRVPEDLAIVSFDGIRESGLVSPGLTTVRQPLKELAEAVLRSVGAKKDTNKTIPVDLIVRSSCGCHPTREYSHRQ